MDDIRIQIVNYKTKKYLLECLRTVFIDLEGTESSWRIAILDNNSGDDLSDIPSLFPGHAIEISTSKKNVGFGAGHNALAKNGRAKYLLLLNPDIMIIEPNTISRLFSEARELKAPVLGPRLLIKKNKVQVWDHGELEGKLAQIANAMGGSYWRRRKKRCSVAWVSGAVFMIEKKWFDKVGGFDENFFLYKEEEDLCLRIRQKGGEIFYDPSITLFHHNGVVAKKSEHMKRSKAYFIKKHLKKPA